MGREALWYQEGEEYRKVETVRAGKSKEPILPKA